jgi:uncharacterized membrane protein YraQ (UPF0718 family)
MGPSIGSLWRSWVIVGSLVAAGLVAAWRTGGPGRVGEALASGAGLFWAVLPNLILGFTLAGLLHVLIPPDAVGRWMGENSGWQGLLIGTAAGMITPGGPFTHFPILSLFLSKGAAVGPVCAYIAAWSLVGLNRFIVWELPLLGPRVALVRYAASVAFPPLIGLLAGRLSLFFLPK